MIVGERKAMGVTACIRGGSVAIGKTISTDPIQIYEDKGYVFPEVGGNVGIFRSDDDIEKCHFFFLRAKQGPDNRGAKIRFTFLVKVN